MPLNVTLCIQFMASSGFICSCRFLLLDHDALILYRYVFYIHTLAHIFVFTWTFQSR